MDLPTMSFVLVVLRVCHCLGFYIREEHICSGTYFFSMDHSAVPMAEIHTERDSLGLLEASLSYMAETTIASSLIRSRFPCRRNVRLTLFVKTLLIYRQSYNTESENLSCRAVKLD